MVLWAIEVVGWWWVEWYRDVVDRRLVHHYIQSLCVIYRIVS